MVRRSLFAVLALVVMYIGLRCFDSYDADYTGFGIMLSFIGWTMLGLSLHPTTRIWS